MADNQNAKNAIEEYLNALLLDEYEEQEAGAPISEQKPQKKQSIDVEEPVDLETIAPVDAEFTDNQIKEDGSLSFTIEAESEQLENSQAQEDLLNAEKVTGALADADVDVAKPAKGTDFTQEPSSFVTAAEDKADSTKKPETSNFIAEPQAKTEQRASFVQQEEHKPWIGQTILMPKLRLATGEEVVVKTGTDKAAKLNPSDFNTPPPPANWDNGRPEWGQNRFDCLLFKVMGLTLAVPLVELGGILRIEEAPKALFGQPDWFLGLMRANDENVYLVDTAKWVLPQALIEKQEGEAYEFVIKIHNSSWGLCCNKVAEAISLNPDQVKWRSAGSKRPWLAGTVIKEMCALIDVSAFAQLLQSGHGNMRPVNVVDKAK